MYDALMKIGVYGLGRFGRFWSELLSQRYTVYAYNRSQEREVPEGVIRCSLEQLGECDAVFLCVSISSMENVLRTLVPYLGSNALVIDTCSVKTYPVELMESILPPGTSYLATHPMFGPDSGRNGVENLPLVFCSGSCEAEVQQEWISRFQEFGLNVITMSPDEHDREAAFTQGITHVVGRVLNDMHLKESSIATAGYRSLLNIVEQTCNDPLQLFYDLQRYNPYTHEMRMQLKASIEHTMKLLSEADGEGKP
jgi:prephenate dehydrogenase